MSKVWYNKKETLTIYKSEEFGYHIIYGTNCGNACECKYGRKCKYRRKYKLHNFSITIRDFFQYKLNIKLPHSHVHFSKRWELLSGTKRCPYKVPEKTECCKCKHCDGTDENYHLTCELCRKGQKPTYSHDEYWLYQCSAYDPYEE